MQWYYWLIIAVCSLFSMFSGADMVFHVDKDRLTREKAKEKQARAALKIVEDYDLPIRPFCGNNIVNIFASSLVTFIGLSLEASNVHYNTVIATLCFTIFIIIFVNFAKSFAKGSTIL